MHVDLVTSRVKMNARDDSGDDQADQHQMYVRWHRLQKHYNLR